MAAQDPNQLAVDLPDRLHVASDKWQELATTADACRSKSPAFASDSQASAALSSSGEFSSKRLRRRQASMGGDFITAAPTSAALPDAKVRRWATYIVDNNFNANSLAVVVLFDAYLTAYDIDARAAGHETSAFIRTCSDLCLLLYTLEIPLLLFVRGRRILKDWMVLLDIVIILCGFAEWLLTNLGDALTSRININVLRPLRLARIIRLMQFLRKTRSLKELRKLVTMLATCMKTLVWSFLFGFVVMTMWAMLMVEMVNDLILDVASRTDVFDECGEQCLQAASSVMNANLLLFKTVVAGDSWGLIAVPVIQDYPATAIIFVGSLLTLVFGVLQLIVAVVVDTFAEVRENDVINLAEELEHSLKNDRKYLQKIFDRLDESGTGELTLQNLMDGARRDAEFQSRLRVMDIDEVDLQQLFEMIDADGSGAIEAAEFIAPLSRWVRDSKTAPRFIKYNLQQTMQTQEELLKLSQYSFAIMNQRIQELENILKRRLDSPGGYSGIHEPLEPHQPAEPLDEDSKHRAEADAEELETAWKDLPDLQVGEDFNLEQPNDSARDLLQFSGEGPRKNKDAGRFRVDRAESPQTPDHQTPGLRSDASASELGHALRETMHALERSLASATEAALQQSFAVAERVLQDHLAFPYERRSRSRRRSSKHEAAGSSSISQTVSMKSVEELWPDLSTRASKMEAARRKSVTDKLWTDF